MKTLKTLLLISIVLIYGTIQAQPNMPKEKADSLWAVWEDASLPDTARLKAIDDYAWDGYLYTKPDSAFYYAQLQYDFAKSKGLKKQISWALSTQGATFRIRSDYPKAIDYHTRSLKIKEEIGNEQGIATSLNNIGLIYSDQGNYTKSLDYYNRGLKLREEIGYQQGIPNTLGNIGQIYYYQGNYSKALDYYTRSLKIYQQLGNQQGIALSLHNIGLIYSDQGNYTKALDYYNRSFKINEELGNQKAIASSLNNIGVIYDDQGNYPKALDYYMRSLKKFEELGDQSGISSTLNNIGIIYKEQGKTPQALDYYTRSLKIAEETGNKSGIANSLNNIGMIYSNQGNYPKALDFSQKSLVIAKEIGAPLRIKNASRSLFSTNNLLKKHNKAKPHLSTLYNLLQTELQINFFTLPEHEKQTYFTTMESDYGLYHDFTLNFQDQFENLTDTSYNIALQNKGLTLKSSTAMRSAIQSSGDTTLIKEYEDWLTLKKKIANTSTTDSTYKELTNQANEMERALVKNSTVFSDFDKVKNLKWQDVQAGLKDNEAAIEFVNFKSEIDTANPIIYAALIIKKESQHPEMVKLCNEADLKEILGVFQGNNLDFVNSVYGNQENVQTELYEKVWKPMEESLEGVENIYLSPSGLLHKVAFHAIAKDQNTYLCDVYNLKQQSSTGKIALPDEVAFNKNTEFLMLGGAQYNTDTTANEIWTYLPGTLAETNNIKSYLQKKKFNITHLTGPNASEEKIKAQAPKSNILHVATHGFFFPNPEKVREEMKDNNVYYGDVVFRGNDIDPDKMQRSTRYADWTFVKNKNPLMRSGLALANANDVWQRPALAEGEDGVLTANEVSTLDLRNTDLVVLSACETGLGDIKGSEGVYGLQRAFKMAGAKYLIMSLWQVPDKETAEFMGLFYKHLVKFEDIREAFSKTQKVMRENYDPYYWGAFVLIE